MQRLGAGAADIEHQSFGLEVALRPQRDGASGKDFGLAGADIAHRQVDLGAVVSALVKGDLGGDTRIGQGAGSDHDIVQLHVMLSALAPEAYGVNGNMAGAQRVDRIGADAARVVAPSLSNTTAPMGKSEVSSLNCLRLSPMRVEGALACRSLRLSMRAGASSTR